MPVLVRPQPGGMTTLDPVQKTATEGAQDRHVLGQKHEAKREHPEAEDRQHRKQTSDDQQQACGNAKPAAGRLPQRAQCRAQPLREPIDQSLDTPVVSAGRVPS